MYFEKQCSEAKGKPAHFSKTTEMRGYAGHSLLPAHPLFHDSLCSPWFPRDEISLAALSCASRWRGQWDYRKVGKGRSQSLPFLHFAASYCLVGFPASTFVFPEVPALPTSFSLHLKTVTHGDGFLRSPNSGLPYPPLFGF